MTSRIAAATAGLALVALGGLGPSAAQDSGITIELNKLEARESGCRPLLLFRNGTDAAFDRFVIDLVAFDPDGVVNARVAVDMAPLAADKTVLKAFDLAGVACPDMGRLLLNDVTDCQATPAPPTDCVAAVTTSSRATIDFIK